MPSKAFERGQRAKRAGKALERNPFTKRAGKANARKAEEWALGWESTESMRPDIPVDWKWPALVRIPHPQAGDYGLRGRGLLALFRPQDLVEYDVLRAEMSYQMVSYVPSWAVIPYDLLGAYAGTLPDRIVEEPQEPDYSGHPLKYLWTAWRIQGIVSRWPPLVVSAYEELIHGGTVSQGIPDSATATNAADEAGDGEGE